MIHSILQIILYFLLCYNANGKSTSNQNSYDWIKSNRPKNKKHSKLRYGFDFEVNFFPIMRSQKEHIYKLRFSECLTFNHIWSKIAAVFCFRWEKKQILNSFLVWYYFGNVFVFVTIIHSNAKHYSLQVYIYKLGLNICLEWTVCISNHKRKETMR